MENKQLVESLLDMMPTPIFYKNKEGHYRYFNQAYLDYSGMPFEALYDQTVFDILPSGHAEIHDAADKALMASKGSTIYESEITYPDGATYIMEITKVVDLDGDGFVKGILTMMRDISDRRNHEASVRLTDRMKEAILRLNNQIPDYKGLEDFFEDVLRQFQDLFGHSMQSCILEVGQDNNVRIFASRGYDPQDVKRFVVPLEETFIYLENQGDMTKACIIEDLSRYSEMNILPSDREKETSYVKSSLEIPIMVEDEVKYIISVDSLEAHVFNQNDLYIANYIRTQFQVLLRVFNLYQETLYMARYDAMTDLRNRRYLEESLKKAMKKSQDSGVPLILLLFDLDKLKMMNDAYGHHIGDQYIVAFSDRLKETFSPYGFIGRIGGDEFSCVIETLDQASVIEKIEVMRQDFRKKGLRVGDCFEEVDFSYGIVSYSGQEMSLGKLMRKADENMYAVKMNHRQNDGQE